MPLYASKMRDIDEYIRSIKQSPPQSIEPLPVFPSTKPFGLPNELRPVEKKEPGSQETGSDLAVLQSELIQINYAKAADLATLLKENHNGLLSKRGSLTIDSRTNSLWIQDIALRLGKIKTLVRALDLPVKQVLIEARIVDVTKDFARDLGIRFGISKF